MATPKKQPINRMFFIYRCLSKRVKGAIRLYAGRLFSFLIYLITLPPEVYEASEAAALFVVPEALRKANLKLLSIMV